MLLFSQFLENMGWETRDGSRSDPTTDHSRGLTWGNLYFLCYNSRFYGSIGATKGLPLKLKLYLLLSLWGFLC